MAAEREVLRAGCLQVCFLNDFLRFIDRPVIEIHPIGFERIFQLSDQVSHPRPYFQKASTAPSITAREYGIETIRPPVHAVPGKRDIRVRVGGEILLVESHWSSIPIYK